MRMRLSNLVKRPHLVLGCIRYISIHLICVRIHNIYIQHLKKYWMISIEYQYFGVFPFLSIILLILSSCYLAFRVCSLEQQLSFLSNPTLPLRER